MMRRLLTWLIMAALPGAAAPLAAPAGSVPKQPPVDFSRDVRPILSKNCFACNGGEDKLTDFARVLYRAQIDFDFYLALQSNPVQALAPYTLNDTERDAAA